MTAQPALETVEAPRRNEIRAFRRAEKASRPSRAAENALDGPPSTEASTAVRSAEGNTSGSNVPTASSATSSQAKTSGTQAARLSHTVTPTAGDLPYRLANPGPRPLGGNWGVYHPRAVPRAWRAGWRGGRGGQGARKGGGRGRRFPT